MKHRNIHIGRILAAPGRCPAQENVRVVVEGARIKAIEAAPQSPKSQDHLAMPAMINAHDHGYGVRPLAFGAEDDALECWIAAWAGRPQVDPWLEAAIAFGRMALSGIGATVHCHNSLAADQLQRDAAAVAKAAGDIGIRVAFSCPIADRNAWVYGGPEALLPVLNPEDRRELSARIPNYANTAQQLSIVDDIAAHHEAPGFTVQYGPIGPQWCRDETLAGIADASEHHNRRVHMHLLESQRQREWLDHAYPNGIVTHLDQIGLLSPRLTIAHGVWLRDAECELLAERGVTVAVNTASNLRLRSGIAPVARYLQHRLKFAFGLDGSALDDDDDYLRDLRLTWHLHNGTSLNPALPPARLFQAAHTDGAPIIDGRSDYGELRPGADADMAILDYAAMAHDLIHKDTDPIHVLLTRMQKKHLIQLMVGGRDVVSEGRLVDFDLAEAEAELLTRARAQAAPEQQRQLTRRQRAAIRQYYTENRHLETP